MNGYICVYRHYHPTAKDRQKTLDDAEAASDSTLLEFVEHYDGRFRFFDWGDDPSFFSARTFLGDTRYATWGVCRRDVRGRLSSGDLVIFFCGTEDSDGRGTWRYHYIGFGTVDQAVQRREEVWTREEFTLYRKFYNVLAELRDGVLIQRESFHPYHKDWNLRSEAPYIVFASDRNLTSFNLSNPLHVATYTPPHIPEVWHAEARKLESLLFIERGVNRRLRSSPTGFAHSPINLTTSSGCPLHELREELMQFSAEL